MQSDTRQARLILVRHGESEGNATRRFTRSPEVPLTELGRAQALRAGQAIREDFDPIGVFASPYRRAQQTAEIIGGVVGLEVATEHDIREQHLGDLHGQPYDAMLETESYGRVPPWEFRPPAGETLIEVQSRAVPVVLRLAREHSRGDIVIVSHGGTTRSVWAHLERDWSTTRIVPNCSLLIVPHDGTSFGKAELLQTPD